MKSKDMTVTDKDGTITTFKVVSVKAKAKEEQEAAARKANARTIDRN